MAKHLRREGVDAKTTLTNRDRQILKRIMAKQHKTTTTKVTAELNSHLNNPDKIVRRKLHKSNIYGRVAISKLFIRDVNVKLRKK